MRMKMGYVDLRRRLCPRVWPWATYEDENFSRSPRDRTSRTPAAHPSTAWEDALPCAFHSTEGHSAQDELFQVSNCCDVQLLWAKHMRYVELWARSCRGRTSCTRQRPTLRLRGKTRYHAPSTRHRATPLRTNGSGEPLLGCATAISQAMGYVDLWARLAQAVSPALPSGPPFDRVGRRATMRLPLDTGPLRSGRTDQVSPCCGVQLLFPKQWGMLIFGRDLPNSPGRGSCTPQRPALRLRGTTRYHAPSTRHRATPLRTNGASERFVAECNRYFHINDGWDAGVTGTG